MKARDGQAALFLVVVLLALAVLVFMNVNVFLAVRAKNRAMNAGDAAALAVAKYQGELLNRLGADNLLHFRAALSGDEGAAAEIMERQRRTAFLEPLRGIGLGNAAARDNGVTEAPDDRMRRILLSHVADIRSQFVADPQLYPEPWSGAWEEYASLMETELAAPLLAGPDNANFADARTSFPLTTQAFYQAIAGRMWCWFKFNGPELFDCDVDALPQPDYTAPSKIENSEIYSLHVTFKPLPAFFLTSHSERAVAWRRTVAELVGCSEEDLVRAPLLRDPNQRWVYYNSRWDAWSTYDGIRFSPEVFPICGAVKREYDVYGAAAICRVRVAAPDVLGEDRVSGTDWRDLGETSPTGAEAVADRLVNWTAGAKPFGTVAAKGELTVVTAYESLVTAAFTDARLVPVDSVGGRDLHTSDPDWVAHVKYHLKASPHFRQFPGAGCWYCVQLERWNEASFRRQGVDWLRLNGEYCVRPTEGGSGQGGTAHAH